MERRRKIYCCGCSADVDARLTNGREIYPHRRDLYALPFWRCDGCLNYVGCHHKTQDATKPLGVIPTPQLRTERGKIHAVIDPIWKSKRLSRGALYAKMSSALGYQFHSAEVRSVEQAKAILDVATSIAAEA